MELAPYLRGCGLGFGLIAAIGTQNAYLLTRGILRDHHWIIASICSFLDALLIIAGIYGMGALITSNPSLLVAITVFGALFLFAYGLLAFKRVLEPNQLRADHKTVSLSTAITTVLTLSLLNPHLYLDTVVLIGSMSVQELPNNRTAFGFGAITASFVWFFSLALGGQCMQRCFQNPKAWRILDAIIGIVMWTLAFLLSKDLM